MFFQFTVLHSSACMKQMRAFENFWRIYRLFFLFGFRWLNEKPCRHGKTTTDVVEKVMFLQEILYFCVLVYIIRKVEKKN